jgi:hypothetical protein
MMSLQRTDRQQDPEYDDTCQKSLGHFALLKSRDRQRMPSRTATPMMALPLVGVNDGVFCRAS